MVEFASGDVAKGIAFNLATINYERRHVLVKTLEITERNKYVHKLYKHA